MASSSSARNLVIVSAIWLLLVAACVLLAHPSIVSSPLGPFAVSMTPNPFWTVHATLVPASPFSITVNWSSLLGIALAPLAALWLLARVLRRVHQRKSGATV
jgi:hypothetical protein